MHIERLTSVSGSQRTVSGGQFDWGGRLLKSNGTVSGGQFDWGGRLLKSNGGARRFPQNGWKSFEECKGRRELD